MNQIIVKRRNLGWYFLFCILIARSVSVCSAQTSEHARQNQSAHNEKANAVKLDNGKKWTANKETTEGINNMISYVKDFTATPPARLGGEAKDYLVLRKNLEKEFTQILQRCTMTGEAHNQLHNYLMPLNEHIQHLQSEDLKLSKESVAEIKSLLNKYSDFFTSSGSK